MKIIATFLPGILLMCIMFMQGCGKKPEIVEKAQPKTIWFFGDSVTNGYGVDMQTESFYARIAKIMSSGMYGDIVTVNAGVNGNDTNAGLQRLSTAVRAREGDMVVIAFGLNDCQNKTMTAMKYSANISLMIDALPEGVEVLLATSNTILESGQSQIKDTNESLDIYMAVLRAIAAERNLSVIDVNVAWKNQIRQDSKSLESLYIDPAHPSAKGHSLFYETYMNTLRRKLIK